MNDSPDSNQLRREQLGAWESVAEGWGRSYRTFEQQTAPLNERLLDLARVGPETLVLDLATGPGEPAATASRRTTGNGHVLATDFSNGMLRAARGRIEAAAPLAYLQQDAETLALRSGCVDAVVSRWGLMLLVEPIRAAREVQRVLRPGGTFAAAVWHADESPFITAPQRPVAEFLGEEPTPPEIGLDADPGPLRLGKPELLTAVLEAGGLTNISLEALTLTLRYQSPRQLFEVLLDLSSRARRVYDELSDDRRAAFETHLVDAYGEMASDTGEIVFPNTILIGTGQRAS